MLVKIHNHFVNTSYVSATSVYKNFTLPKNYIKSKHPYFYRVVYPTYLSEDTDSDIILSIALCVWFTPNYVEIYEFKSYDNAMSIQKILQR